MVLPVTMDVLSVCPFPKEMYEFTSHKAKAPVCSRSSFIAPEQVKCVDSHLLTGM